MTEAMKCPKCGGEVREGGKFCPACGAPVGEGVCLHCGAKMEPGQRFCPECGTPAGQRQRETPVAQQSENICPGCQAREKKAGKQLCGTCEALQYRSVGAPKSFGEAWKRGWKVSFNGRATRQEFWWRVGGLLIESPLYGIIGFGLASSGYVRYACNSYTTFWDAFGGPIFVAAIVFAYPMLAFLGLRVRRLHDLGLSGWWLLLECIPYVGWWLGLVEFVLDCLPGKPTANQYGLPPELVASLKKPNVVFV